MDPEIEAMSKVADALGNVDDAIQRRVIRWAAERYGVVLAAAQRGTKGRAPSEASEDGEETDDHSEDRAGTYDSIADLFVAASPKTGPEKVLVASYWLQVVKNGSDVTSFAVNQELKQLGHKVSSINKVFDALMEQKPQLAVQLKKTGTSKQGRKKYKLTHAGIKKVEQMTSQQAAAE